MAQECNCDTGLFNLQPSSCVATPGIARKFVFVEYFKADGSVNGVNLSNPFGEAEIDALLAQSNKNLRWFLSDRFKNFVTERADPNFETVDNENLFISQGTRTMTGNFYAAGTVGTGTCKSNEPAGLSGIINLASFLLYLKS